MTLSATYSTTASVSRSAHCRSSTINIAVPAPASETSRRSTASPRTGPDSDADGALTPFRHERRQRRNERRHVATGTDPQPCRSEQRFPERPQRRRPRRRSADEHDPSVSDGPRSQLTDQPALSYNPAGPRTIRTEPPACDVFGDSRRSRRLGQRDCAPGYRSCPAYVRHGPRLSQGTRRLAVGAASCLVPQRPAGRQGCQHPPLIFGCRE